MDGVLDKTCEYPVDGTPCGQPAEDYPWGTRDDPSVKGLYWCDNHVRSDMVADGDGSACMGCEAVCADVEEAKTWYIDNGGQLCAECMATSEERVKAMKLDS